MNWIMDNELDYGLDRFFYFNKLLLLTCTFLLKNL